MHTVEQSPHDPATESPADTPDTGAFLEYKIGGFDGGNLTVFKEPSLYLSILIIFIATFACLGNTPIVFWVSFVSMTALAITYHMLAERILFRANKDYAAFDAPFEGVFVVTLGSIIPGGALLAYGVSALTNAPQSSILEELGKLALLLVVPIFNFLVWSAVRRKYLVRPRLTGLMNGLAIGLSVSWMGIWLGSLFSSGLPSCKFGWMLLLCTSPFLLCAAACLSYDLWKNTKPGISRITTTFSILGGLLSMLFVFTPMVRALVLQSLVTDAKHGSVAQKTKAVSSLRSLATAADLRPSKNPVNGFTLAELLIRDRGLDGGSDDDKNAYFKITGKSYVDDGEKKVVEEQSSFVGHKVAGLVLSKSHISGQIDASTLSSSVDWMFGFRNSNWTAQEARAEISLPKGAVVSRATLWINGEPREAVFASATKTRAAYEAVLSRQQDPLLVTTVGTDRVLVQCFPVQVSGGEMKVRIGFKVPLQTTDGKTCTMQLPKLLSTNFSQPKRHRVNLISKDLPVKSVAGIATQKAASGYALNGILKTDEQSKTVESVVVQRTTSAKEIAVADCFSRDKRFIVQQLQEVVTPAPKRLFVVLDSSESMKVELPQINETLSKLPPKLKPVVYFSPELSDDKEPSETERSVTAQTLGQISLTPESFVGGQNNLPVLRQALETAAEEPNSAVLWIHGPQPMTQPESESTVLDLVHNVGLYDLQIGDGPNSVLKALRTEDISNLIRCEYLQHHSTEKDVSALLSRWEKGMKSLCVQRKMSSSVPQETIVADKLVAAQVNCLWAEDQINRLMEIGQDKQAMDLASKYHLVTPLTGAVVLESAKDYKSFQLNLDAYKDRNTVRAPGLVGTPVDPRYGQSNEVGMLSDFGYDTARDIARMLTGVSFLVALIMSIVFLRSGAMTAPRLAKAAALVFLAPTIVHIMGTFMINNYGGLGGGL